MEIIIKGMPEEIAKLITTIQNSKQPQHWFGRAMDNMSANMSKMAQIASGNHAPKTSKAAPEKKTDPFKELE